MTVRYRVARKVIAVIAAVTFAGAVMMETESFSVYAANSGTLNKLKQQASSLSDQESELRSQLKTLEGRVNSKLEEKEVLEQQISVLSAQIFNTEALISEYEIQISDKQIELEQAQSEEDEYYQVYCTRVRDMEEQGSISYWSILFSSASFSDLLDRIDFVSEIVDYDNQIFDQLQAAREAVAQAKTDLETQQAEQQEAKEALETQKTSLAEEETAVDATIAEINSQKEIYSAQLAEVQSKAEALEDQIAAEQAAAEESASKQNSGTEQDSSSNNRGSSSSGSGLIWPCGSSRITSYFGKRSSPTAGASTYHKGVDIGASTGTAIYAAASGTVVTATYSSSAGNYITISHGNGLSTSYMHCSALYVSVGDTVSQGQTIAAVGSTGVSTGSHLHFAVIENGTYKNPLDYV